MPPLGGWGGCVSAFGFVMVRLGVTASFRAPTFLTGRNTVVLLLLIYEHGFSYLLVAVTTCFGAGVVLCESGVECCLGDPVLSVVGPFAG